MENAGVSLPKLRRINSITDYSGPDIAFRLYSPDRQRYVDCYLITFIWDYRWHMARVFMHLRRQLWRLKMEGRPV